MPARPSLEEGFESKANLERQMVLERELTELRYKTQMERQMTAKPQLVPGFESTVNVEHKMDVVPLVQKQEEKFTTNYTADVSVQVAAMNYMQLKIPFDFVKFHLSISVCSR